MNKTDTIDSLKQSNQYNNESDVTVYMRRGRFHENPELVMDGNRRLGDEDDVFPSNIVSDYKERGVINKESEPLSDKWLKDEDAREYAIKLTKYSGIKKTYSDEPELKMQPEYPITLQPTRRLSKIPNLIETTVWHSGNSEIVMRKFLPLHEITEESRRKEPNDYFYNVNKPNIAMKPSEIDYNESQSHLKVSVGPDIEISLDDISERYLMPISDRPTNLNRIHDEDDFPDEENEDNIIYKPV